MANIREIAEKAGVSIATVSRYLNGTERVSKESGLKIQREIDRVGYVPNALAKAIFTKKSEVIALMIPNIVNPFFNQLATVIEELCHEKGYTLMLCNTEDNKEKESKYIDVLKAHRVAGIIASRPKCKEQYLNSNIPVVSFENKIDDSIVSVSSDNYDGGRMAFEHLYEKGCRKILHIKGPDTFDATEQRYEGFLDASKGKDVQVDMVSFKTDFNLKMLSEDLLNLDCKVEEYDGIFVFNDIAAAAVIKHLRDKRVDIPRDIKIIGFDDSFISELLNVSLTTIRQPIEKLGKAVAQILLDEIEGKEVSKEDIMIKTEIIERETTLV